MTNWMIWNVLQLLFCIFTPPVKSAFHSVALKLSYYEDRNKSIAFQSADAYKKMVTPATIFLYAWDQYQSCFSLRSRATIWFISSSVREKPKRSRFSRIWSGLLEPGMTTMPRCRFQHRMTWAEVARRLGLCSRIWWTCWHRPRERSLLSATGTGAHLAYVNHLAKISDVQPGGSTLTWWTEKSIWRQPII